MIFGGYYKNRNEDRNMQMVDDKNGLREFTNKDKFKKNPTPKPTGTTSKKPSSTTNKKTSSQGTSKKPSYTSSSKPKPSYKPKPSITPNIGTGGGHYVDRSAYEAEKARAEKEKREAYLKHTREVYDAYVDRMNKYYTEQKSSLAEAKKQKDLTTRNIMETRISELNSYLPRLEKSYNDSARDAYLDYMEVKKALPEQLLNMGINGGLTESAATKLSLNYQNNLHGLKQGYKSSVGDIMSKIDRVKSDAYRELRENEKNYYDKLSDFAHKQQNDLTSLKNELRNSVKYF